MVEISDDLRKNTLYRSSALYITAAFDWTARKTFYSANNIYSPFALGGGKEILFYLYSKICFHDTHILQVVSVVELALANSTTLPIQTCEKKMEQCWELIFSFCRTALEIPILIIYHDFTYYHYRMWYIFQTGVTRK